MKPTEVTIYRNKETNRWQWNGNTGGKPAPLGEEIGEFALNKVVILFNKAKADFFADDEMLKLIKKQIKFLESFKPMPK
jgi:hypothetical protein